MTTEKNYWSRALRTQMARRRMLGGAGAATLGAVLLAACGGGEGGGQSAGLLTKAVDSTKQAKRGGILKTQRPTDVQTWDPYVVSSPTAWHETKVYEHLLSAKPGYFEPYAGEVDPGLAESFELSPDKTQITFKLRTNAKLDPRPPTNGRPVTSEDAIFSWNRFEATAGRRADVSNKINPSAAIVSMSAPDANTVVVKTAFPDSTLLIQLATGAERFQVLPKEAESQFDPRLEMRGSGPFYMSEYKPSIGFTYKRNPGYWNTQQPYIDGMDVPILGEYASALAQFRSGSIWVYDDVGAGSLIRSEDILPTKRDVPEIGLFTSQLNAPTGRGFYGFEGGLQQSPLVDQRVRQAFSMALDRDLWIDTFFNVSPLKSQGIAVETRWTSMINPVHQGWWLDPQGKDFGPNAKYYTRNIAEAKKLLSAAAFPGGVEFASHHLITADYGRDFPKMIEVVLGMVADAGIKIRIEPSGFTSDFRRKFADSQGAFDGLCYANLTATEVGQWLAAVYNSTGSLYKGFSPNSNRAAGDPYMDDTTLKINREFDTKKRWAMAHELQRYEADKQYMFPFPGGATGIILSWPVVENRFVFDGPPEELSMWINDKKAPLNKS